MNADADMAHGLVVIANGAASSWMPMMGAVPAVSGPAPRFLGESTSSGMHEGTISSTASATGRYQYICAFPRVRAFALRSACRFARLTRGGGRHCAAARPRYSSGPGYAASARTASLSVRRRTNTSTATIARTAAAPMARSILPDRRRNELPAK